MDCWRSHGWALLARGGLTYLGVAYRRAGPVFRAVHSVFNNETPLSIAKIPNTFPDRLMVRVTRRSRNIRWSASARYWLPRAQ